MKRAVKLMVLLAALALVTACAKKETTPEKKAGEKTEKPAEKPAEEPAAEEPEKPAAEEPEKPAAEEPEKPAEQPAAEEPEKPAVEEPEKPVEPTAESNLRVAVYAVPALDDAVAKQLSLALADWEGVVAARADKEAGLFKVTFKAGEACPGAMRGTLSKVAPDLKFKEVVAADGAPAKMGCGGCPNKSSCGH